MGTGPSNALARSSPFYDTSLLSRQSGCLYDGHGCIFYPVCTFCISAIPASSQLCWKHIVPDTVWIANISHCLDNGHYCSAMQIRHISKSCLCICCSIEWWSHFVQFISAMIDAKKKGAVSWRDRKYTITKNQNPVS